MVRDRRQPARHLSEPIHHQHHIQKQIRLIVHTIGDGSDLDVAVAPVGAPDLFRSAGGSQ